MEAMFGGPWTSTIAPLPYVMNEADAEAVAAILRVTEVPADHQLALERACAVGVHERTRVPAPGRDQLAERGRFVEHQEYAAA